MTTKSASSTAGTGKTSPRQVSRSADAPAPADDATRPPADEAAPGAALAAAAAQRWQRARQATTDGVERMRTAVREADPATRQRWRRAAVATGAAAVPVAVAVAAVVRRRRRRPRALLRRLLASASVR
ncbi:hypothetical protein GCM10010123_44690 [Pilimelia anulata]|uniref:Uncharacterized protein n=1 Tax=Pilimelia anulata TaxID=53371 RepID=A0A8J3FCS3_9ACTN|nr:hypothetical protein [Pilimelia anulata]GGK09836.1 hypothetical protein GCM10010123_44690 [Pilimelia anulata]